MSEEFQSSVDEWTGLLERYGGLPFYTMANAMLNLISTRLSLAWSTARLRAGRSQIRSVEGKPCAYQGWIGALPLEQAA